MKVYCVYAYPRMEGCDEPEVEKVFSTFTAAEKYMKEKNGDRKWRCATRIEEHEVED